MAKESLEELTTDQLTKRKKFGALILGILVGLIIVNVVVGVLAWTPALGVTSLALLAVGLPMFLGIKKINAELAKRDDG